MTTAADAARAPRVPARVVLLVAFAALFAARWPARARHLAADEPSHPMWTAALDAARLLRLDRASAASALSLSFSAAAVAATFALVRMRARVDVALLLAAAIACAPGVTLAGAIGSPAAVDVVASSLLALLAARLFRGGGDARLAPLAGATLAALAGARPASALAMLPLVGAAVARANARDRRAWARTIAATTIAALIWLVRAPSLHGLVGAPASPSLRHALADAGQVAVWTLRDVAPLGAVLLLLAVASARPWNDARSVDARAREAPLPRWFFALWIAPFSAFVALGRVDWPGEALFLLPPLLAMVAAPLDGLVAAAARRLRAERSAVIVASTGVVLALSTLLATRPDLRAVDDDFAALDGALRARAGDGQAVVLPAGASPSALAAPPGTSMWTVGVGGTVADRDGARTDAVRLPTTVERVLWLVDVADAATVASSTRARVLHRGSLRALLEIELSAPAVDLHVPLRDAQVHLTRAAAPIDLRFRFDEGFAAPEHQGDLAWIWSLGPGCSMSFRVPRAVDVVATIHIGPPPEPQSIELAANDFPASLPVAIAAPRDVVLRFRAVPGENHVSLRFARWNRHPASFAPSDPRALALPIERVTLEADGVPTVVFPPSRP